MSQNTETKKKKGLHSFALLVIIMLIAAVVANFLPAGEYARVLDPVTGRSIVDPESFKFITHPSFNLVKVMTALPRGIEQAANVVVITFAVGAAFGVIKKTGMLNLGIQKLVAAFAGAKLAIIFVLYFVFAAICGFIGVPELCLVYIPVLMPLMFKLGFDSMVTTGLSLFSTAAGFSAALSAPATTGLGHQLAELPLYSGMPFRAFVVFVLALSAAIYTALYAKKILADPTKSIVYEEDIQKRADAEAEEAASSADMAPRAGLAGIVAIILFICLIAGVIIKSWGFEEMAGYFIFMGVVVGFVAGLDLSTIMDSIVDGLKEMLVGALICGVARGISIVLTDACVMDTIIYYLAKIVVGLPAQAASIGMFLVTSVFNAIIASGSGKAVISLPIMLPLGDMVHVNRQISILAYQMGDGITNLLWPASGYFMGAIALGKISYKKWVKWALPLIIIWTLLGCVVLLIAGAINWGPF